MKPVLFVDVDGTVADSMTHWLDLYNIKFGTHYNVDHIKEYHLSKTFENWEVFDAFYKDYRGVIPVFGAMRAIETLRRYYRVVFVTVGYGEDWVKSWFSPEKQDFIKIADRSLLRGYALIDDCPDNLDVFQGERFLLRQPWNQDRGLNEVTWEEITSYLVEVAHETFGNRY